LRRTKETKFNGTKILDLPSKDYHEILLEFSAEEEKTYSAVFKKMEVEFNDMLKMGKHVVLKNYLYFLENILRLRQICDHQNLIVFKEDSEEDKLPPLKCPECTHKIIEGVVTECQHVFCSECINVYLTMQDTCPTCNVSMKEPQLKHFSTKPKYLQNFYHSTKTKAVIDKLKEILKEKPNDKIIIFTQWTQFMDLLEIPMKGEFPYIRIDGKMSGKDRDVELKKFKSQDEIKIALLSLLACGVGLNLNEANHVLFCDPWWNPMIELQAIDRTHRIGQEKDVQIYKFLVKNSVEKKIQILQNRKKLIADVALGEIKPTSTDALTFDDLKFLFTRE
jgi:SNF2 family DNA or RNA helicase